MKTKELRRLAASNYRLPGYEHKYETGQMVVYAGSVGDDASFLITGIYVNKEFVYYSGTTISGKHVESILESDIVAVATGPVTLNDS